MYSLLKAEVPYFEINLELEEGGAQMRRNEEVYKRMNGICLMHLDSCLLVACLCSIPSLSQIGGTASLAAIACL